MSFSGTGITVNSTSYMSPGELTANITVAAGATVGARNITVTNADNGAATQTSGFTVTAAPTVTSASPSSRGQGAAGQPVYLGDIWPTEQEIQETMLSSVTAGSTGFTRSAITAAASGASAAASNWIGHFVAPTRMATDSTRAVRKPDAATLTW